MLTKRIILGGALALVLAVSACSEDRAGGATGVSEVPTAPGVRPVAPAVIVPPGAPEGVRPGGDGEAVTTVSSSYYEGHQVVLSEVTTSSGAKVNRVSLDGAVLMEYTGDEATGGETADAKVFLDGQLILNETLDLRSFISSSAGSPGLVLPGAPQGPQLMAALPCASELAMFGAASLAVSGALAWFKFAPSGMSWDALKMAVGAEIAATYRLFACLKKHW